MYRETNSPIHLRPRFTMELSVHKEVLIGTFKKVLREEAIDFPSKFVDGHIVIDVPKASAHFWSPQLLLEIEMINEDNSRLKGLFGPKPQVWTLFMFIHAIIGVSFLVFAIMFYVRWRLDGAIVFPLIMSIFLPLVWVLLYFLGRIGKSTGHAQMEDLHKLLLRILQS